MPGCSEIRKDPCKRGGGGATAELLMTGTFNCPSVAIQPTVCGLLLGLPATTTIDTTVATEEATSFDT
jgi:hypothetical protein